MWAGRGTGGHDVGDYIVDADGFSLGECSEGDLDLWHAVRVWVVFGIFAKFLEKCQLKISGSMSIKSNREDLL